MDTIDYYNINAESYFFKTVNADMRGVYNRFIPYLKSGDYICDLGCGSGRDSKYFLEKGFSVLPIDGSLEMCKLASRYLGVDVVCKSFEDIDYENLFDAVWACSSLLHVPKKTMPDIMNKIIESCKTSAAVYMCFKYGEDETYYNDVFYSNYTEELVNKLLLQFKCINQHEMWLSYDVRNLVNVPQWLNVIFKIMK